MKTTDVMARVMGGLLGIVLLALYIGMAVALYPIMDDRLGGWFTVVCFLIIMALLTNLFVPGWSAVGKIWMSGSPRRRHVQEVEALRQRTQLDLMTAKSRLKYGTDGPPESRNGDVSPDRSTLRDAGAGRR